MQRVAQDWLVLELTHGSPAALGITVGLQFLPILLFSAWGGGLADRFHRRKMLMVTSSLLGTLALTLGVLVLTGAVSVPLVMLMAFLVGSVAAIDSPTRQAFVSEMVGHDDLTNAVALNTASFNLGRVVGPALAGLLIAAVGSGWVFLINALGYVAVIIALRGVRVADLISPPKFNTEGADLRDGVRYVLARRELVLVLAIAFFVGTFGLNFQLTIASMTTVQFGLGPAQFGLASTVLALGSLTGSLAAARRGAPRLRLVVLAAVAFGIAGVTAAMMPSYVMFLIALPLVGVSALTLINATQSFLQLHSAPEYRGRVMGLYTLVFMGGTPLGSPIVGWIASTAGPRWSIAIGGIVSALAALAVSAYWLRKRQLAVRAHLTPRPHLHIGDRASLAGTRRGPSIAMGTHSLVIPAILLLGAAFAVSPSTDVAATHSSDATVVTTLQDPRLDESSGMTVSQLHPGVVWIVNDSKGGPYVYGVDDSGNTVARLTLNNIMNRDWEAMAPGVDDSNDPALWIGDIGDNDANYESIKLYRISEPTTLGDQTADWRRCELKYPDGPHNAEALLISPDDATVYVVTKEAFVGAVYATDGPCAFGATTVMHRIASAPMFVTDGSISPDGEQVALRTYTSLYRYHAANFLAGDTSHAVKSALPRQPQGETVAYTKDSKSVLVGTEGALTPIYNVPLTPMPPSENEPPSTSDGTPTKTESDSSITTWMAVGIGGFVVLCLIAAIVVTARGRRTTPKR